MGFPRQEYWSVLPSPSPGDLPDPGTRVSCIGRRILYCWATREAPYSMNPCSKTLKYYLSIYLIILSINMNCFLRLSDWTISVYMLSKMQLISDSNWLVLLYPQAFALRSVLGLRFCSHFWTVFASTIPSPRPFHWYVVFSHFVFGRNLESSFQEWGTCGQKSYTEILLYERRFTRCVVRED